MDRCLRSWEPIANSSVLFLAAATLSDIRVGLSVQKFTLVHCSCDALKRCVIEMEIGDRMEKIEDYIGGFFDTITIFKNELWNIVS